MFRLSAFVTKMDLTSCFSQMSCGRQNFETFVVPYCHLSTCPRVCSPQLHCQQFIKGKKIPPYTISGKTKHYPPIAEMYCAPPFYLPTLYHHGLCCTVLDSNNNSLTKNPMDQQQRWERGKKQKHAQLKNDSNSVKNSENRGLGERPAHEQKHIYQAKESIIILLVFSLIQHTSPPLSIH